MKTEDQGQSNQDLFKKLRKQNILQNQADQAEDKRKPFNSQFIKRWDRKRGQRIDIFCLLILFLFPNIYYFLFFMVPLMVRPTSTEKNSFWQYVSYHIVLFNLNFKISSLFFFFVLSCIWDLPPTRSRALMLLLACELKLFANRPYNIAELQINFILSFIFCYYNILPEIIDDFQQHLKPLQAINVQQLFTLLQDSNQIQNLVGLIIINTQNYKIMSELFPIYVCFFPLETTFLAYCQQEPASLPENKTSSYQEPLPHITEIENEGLYLQLLRKQLEINSQKFEKKVWLDSEVQELVRLKQNGLGWDQISQMIGGTNSQVCKRKYQRLKLEQKKWSKELDERVKYLCQVEQRNWKEIYLVLKQQYNIRQKRKLRLIKQRYRLYLRSEISKLPWTVDQDLALLEYVKEKGRKWKQISKKFKDRTELQVKNRFYGTLLPITNRVLRMIGVTNRE